MSESSPGAATIPTGSSAVPPITGSLVPAGVPVDAAGVPVGEACPPPLVWQEVLQAYRKESTPWELDLGTRKLVGRSWGQGPPLYLLNGFVATAELQALMMYILRDSFRCVVYDTVSAPKSRRRRMTVDDYSADLFTAADQLEDSSICVMGPSFGAAVALNAARQQRQRIAGLCLLHGFAQRRLSWSERLLAAWYRGSQRTLDSLTSRRRVQELNHRRWFPPFDGTRFEFLVESTGKLTLADLVQKAMAIHRFNIQDHLAEITSPVLLVRTEGQGKIEADGHEVLEKHLPNARTEWLHSTGMHPYLTHPHRLAKLLKQFFLEGKPSHPS